MIKILGTLPQTFPKSANVLRLAYECLGSHCLSWPFFIYSPVEALHFLSVCNTILRFSASGLRSFSSTRVAAHSPILMRGGSTVVSCGYTMEESSVPENPATMTSSGIRSPSSRRRFIAPMASVSVNAYTASKEMFCRTRLSMALAPSAKVIPVPTTSRGS